jgi:pre-mRNA-splicing factor 18
MSAGEATACCFSCNGEPSQVDCNAGNQATLQYQQTMTFFKPLYRQLRQKEVHPEMVAGLYMIVEAIQQRNYLHAYDVYMRLAIGRAFPPQQ